MAVEVLCVGHATYDLSVFVEEFPRENSKCETRELIEAGGGPAANAAYLLSKWGTPCAFAGLVGADRYGRQVRDEFHAVGTDTTLLELRPDHATPFSMILVNRRNGSRTIVNRKAAVASFQPDPASLAALAPSVLLFDGHELEASLAALTAFPEAPSILDAGSWRHGTAELAGRVDYLVASERFAREATGVSGLATKVKPVEYARLLREVYPTTVVVTLGERGLVAADGNGAFLLPAFPAKAADTTAAGDVFHGAFAWMIHRGASFRETLEFASMAASLSVRVRGGRASIPSLEDVKEALRHAG